jgi:hypothetical protein
LTGVMAEYANMYFLLLRSCILATAAVTCSV